MEGCVGISPTAAKKLYLILACVASQDNDGWFETSRRRLADFAGVTVDSARRFLEWLDESGQIEIARARAGRVKRRFVWVGQIAGEMTHPSEKGWVKSPGIRPGGGSKTREIDPPSGSNRRGNDPHYITYSNVTEGAGAYADATAPPPAPMLDDDGLPDPKLHPHEYAVAILAKAAAMADTAETAGDA